MPRRIQTSLVCKVHDRVKAAVLGLTSRSSASPSTHPLRPDEAARQRGRGEGERQQGVLAEGRRAEWGGAMLGVLVGSGVIGVALASYLALISHQNRMVMRSQAWNSAMPLVEAGIEEALTHLNVHGMTNLSSDGWFYSYNNAHYRWRLLDPGFYIVGISNVTPPVIYSSGYARNPGSYEFIAPRTVMVRTRVDALFARGMVAKGQIDLKGNNVQTDSFDSADPNYSTGGRYDSAKARDQGDVATNSGLVNSLSVGNANIYGRVATGPGGSVSVGSNGGVGSRAWQNAGNRGIQPGWSSDDMNVSFPDVKAPFTAGMSPSGGTVGGTNYTYVFGTGNYLMSSLSMSGQGQALVNGHAVVYVMGSLSISGSAFIFIQTNNASLKLYVGGPSASLGGNGVINATGNALDFSFYGLPTLTGLSYSGNAAFVGTVYAPNADFSLGGGGNNTYDFVGASITSTVSMNGHFNFHYDENLGRMGPARGFIVTSWDELGQ